jgi:glycosyltransferase involved in cell wall biosynthesis
LKNNPDTNFRICVVDTKGESIEELSHFQLVSVSELGFGKEELYKRALMLDEGELTSALQPRLLEYVLNEGHSHALYLAPEIFVYGDLGEVTASCYDHAVVLTPNLLDPLPSDEFRPSEQEMLNLGSFQSGFIAVGKESKDFLKWWKERSEIDPFSRPDTLHIKSQRWLDLVPGMWATKIISDPGYNVGYWNASERNLRLEEDRLFAKGSALKFFNFHSFEPESPWVLSPEIGDESRLWPSESAALSRICDDYLKNLASNPEPHGNSRYGFATLDGYGEISKSLREAFRSLVSSRRPDQADSAPIPFVGEDKKVIDFINKKVPGSDFVSNPMMSLWRQRQDLQLAFPDLMGVDGPSYLTWARTSGIEEGHLTETDFDFLQENEDHSEKTTVLQVSRELGVNIVGYFTSELGMGELARIVLETVELSGIPTRTLVSNRNKSRKSIKHTVSNPKEVFPINVAVLNADQMTNWKELKEYSDFSHLPTIGVWAWELEDFPSGFEKVFDFVDEVWTISEFSRKSIEQATQKPVFVIPLPAKSEQADFFLAPKFGGLDLSNTDYFLSMFDYQSSIERKNPMAVIEAFREAFEDDTSVRLIIKTVNAQLWPTQRERLSYLCRNYKNITLIDSYLEPDEVKGLMKNAVAYVSLHRSEGYGLTCAEAMALGTPVIATRYSGNLDFMDDENSLLVDYDLVQVNDPTGTYKADSKWADPRIDSAVKQLKRVYFDKSFAKKIGIAGVDSLRSSSNFESAVEFVKNRLIRAHSRAIELAQEQQEAERLAERQRRKNLLKQKVTSIIPSRIKNWIRQLLID